jgi:hypothetical protein
MVDVIVKDITGIPGSATALIAVPHDLGNK